MSNPTHKLILTFEDEAAYEKYKKLVTESGGTITQDYGTIALGFAATLPEDVAKSIQSGNLAQNGITSLEHDEKVTIQKK